MNNPILAIDTSCDETSAAVTDGRRVLSNVISSQIDIHKKYGGVFPALAKRAHEERIDWVIKEALKRAGVVILSPDGYRDEGSRRESNTQRDSSASPQNDRSFIFPISAIAVTQGPGLAIALEVGIRKAKELIIGCGWEMRSGSGNEDEKWGKNNNLSSLPTPDALLPPATQASLLALRAGTSHPHPQLIAVNHLEGHIYSCLAENNGRGLKSAKTEKRNIAFPSLCLIVSGGHTELVLMKNHGVYEVVGETLDDACGEALDKAAKILKLGYPGGPIIERLAEDFLKRGCGWEMRSGSGNEDEKCVKNNQKPPPFLTPDASLTSHPHSKYSFSQPLPQKSNLNFSYSGLKTQFLYLTQKMTEEEFNNNLKELAFSFQSACFEQIIRKISQAIKVYQPKTLLCGGGVIANKTLRKELRKTAKAYNLPVFFPPKKNLITDNAAMIGIAAGYKLQRKEFVLDIEGLEREPRLSL